MHTRRVLFRLSPGLPNLSIGIRPATNAIGNRNSAEPYEFRPRSCCSTYTTDSVNTFVAMPATNTTTRLPDSTRDCDRPRRTSNAIPKHHCHYEQGDLGVKGGGRADRQEDRQLHRREPDDRNSPTGLVVALLGVG